MSHWLPRLKLSGNFRFRIHWLKVSLGFDLTWGGTRLSVPRDSRRQLINNSASDAFAVSITSRLSLGEMYPMPDAVESRAAAQTYPFRFSPPANPLSIGSPGPSRAHRLHWGTKKPPLPCLPRTGAPLSKNVWALERLPQWSHATIDGAPSQHKPDHVLHSTPSPIPRHPSTLRDSMRAFVGPCWS